MYFPPAGGGGVQRPLKFATHLPALGIETHVLAPDDPKWVHRDDDLVPPTQAWVHRVRYLGPKGRLPAEELHGVTGIERAARKAGLTFRRALAPDENVTWNLTAIPAAIRIVRREKIDVVLTTSPPTSVHLVGAAVRRATGARWIADLRDSIVANPHRRTESALVRAKERTGESVARLVARKADAVVAVSDPIAEELRALGAARVETISNGCDFEDFAGLEYTPRPASGSRTPAASSAAGARGRSSRPWPARTWTPSSASSATSAPPTGSSPRPRPGRPARAPSLPAAARGARDPEGLGGAAAPDPGLRRPRPRRAVREGVRVPRRRAADPGGGPDGRRRGRPSRETGAGTVVAPDDVEGLRAAIEGLDADYRGGRLNGTPLSPRSRSACPAARGRRSSPT